MSKRNIGSKVLIYPLPIALFGTIVNDKPTYNTLGNIGIMSLTPATLYVSSYENHYTNKGARENNEFSVNIPSTDLAKETDFCGIVHGNINDKSEVFESYYGKLKSAPLIKECPVNMACKVIKQFKINDMEIFVGEIIETFVNEEIIANLNKPKIKDVNPLIYSLDMNYYSIGKKVARAFSIGKEYDEGKKKQ